MADKILNTRLRLKYDTLANWTAANPVLLEGEVGVVSVPLASETTAGQVVKPAILFKVGDGTTSFETLPWASGMAADVHAWAKEAVGRAEDIKVFDEDNAFIGKTVTEALAQLNTEIGALTGGGESGSISQMINDAINALDVSDTAVEGQYVSAITQEDGKIKVVRASLPDYSSVYASKSIENEVANIKSDYLKSSDKTELINTITTETTRATEAEEALGARIDVLEAYDHTTYATKSEVEVVSNELAGVKVTAEAAATKTALEEEIARATKAEGDLAAQDVLIEADIEALEARVGTAEGKITTLIGEDANKSVRTIANEELAKQLIAEGASESLDTLQEIAAWIQSHPDDASAMNDAITALQAKTVLGNDSEGNEYATVKVYVEAAIAALKIGDYALAADLTALADRVTANETSITDITKDGGAIDTAIEEEVAARNAAITTAKQEAIDAAAADATTKAGTAETNAKDYADSLAENYATAAQGEKADTAIQEITTTADNGLKVSKTGTTVNIDLDETVTFILYGGTATELV